MEKFLTFLEKQTRNRLMAAALIWVIVLSIADYLTGQDITLSFFYIIPIALVAWSMGRKEGIFLSVTSALTWAVVNEVFGKNAASLFIAYWNAAAHLGFFLLFTYLLSEVHLLLEKERALARTDFLTGALNRRAFFEIANTEIMRMSRIQRPFTIIYLDLDGFKAVNDLQGHDAGDNVLRLVVKTIASNIRIFDSIGRLGGDEFVILLPETNHQVTKSIAPRIQTILLQNMRDNHFPVTFSMGAITYLTPPENVESMLKQADEMLYQVKKAGKNAIHYAEN